MFQAWLVKMAKMQASSAPNIRPGERLKNQTTVTEMKPRIGTDCRISSNGTSKRSGARTFRRPGGVGEGEDERDPHRHQHAKRGAQRITGQPLRIQAQRDGR